MTSTSRRIQKGELVLVTGANGYIASHVVDVLLREGYKVRGTLRRDLPDINQYFDSKYGAGHFETMLVPAMETASAFEAAVAGVSAIIHLASNLSVNPDPNAVIPQTIAGTLNILTAAAAESSVKSVVITSSCAAAYTPKRDQALSVDENSWNDEAVKAAWSDATPADDRGFQVYIASKVESERAAWDWIQKNKPNFAFNTVLPPFNSGPILSPAFHASTMGFVLNLVQGDDSLFRLLPPQWHVDVRDNAAIHVAALLDPKTQGKRLFPFSRPFSWSEMLAVLRTIQPKNENIPQAPDDNWLDPTVLPSARDAEDLLKSFFSKPGYISFKDSISSGI